MWPPFPIPTWSIIQWLHLSVYALDLERVTYKLIGTRVFTTALFVVATSRIKTPIIGRLCR